MPHSKMATTERTLVDLWNDLGTPERLNMILNYRDLFLSCRLVTADELAAAESISESEREYILEREHQPMFTKVCLKSTIETQTSREKLMTALKAVFC